MKSIRFTTNEKVAETSSKGNQEKWRESGRWYKLDQFGYEALAEAAVSALLEASSIETETPFTFVRYRMERIHVHGRERTGCSSADFLKPSQSILTLSHLLGRHTEKPLLQVLTALPSDRQRIAYLAETTAELTGLTQFPQYLTLLFEVDALFLNDVAVLEQGGVYDYCPIFDNGAGLLSNTQLSPMDIAPKALLSGLTARPFHTSFTRQRNTAQKLYGAQMQIPKFSRGQIEDILAPLLPYYAQRDRALILDRVWAVIAARQRR